MKLILAHTKAVTSPMRRTFRDPRLEATFRDQGYVVTPLLLKDDVREIVDTFAEVGGPELGNFTIDSDDIAYRKEVSAQIARTLARRVEVLLDDHTTFAFNFMTKAPKAPHLALHQDVSVVDETEFCSLNVWCPLHDVDEHSGCLTVVPGSHRWSSDLRAFADTLEMSTFRDVAQILEEHHEQPVPLQGGHALMYHARAIHGCSPNETSNQRLTAFCAAKPREARIVWHYRVSDTVIERFAAAEDFFWKEMFVFQRPKHTQSLGEEMWRGPQRYVTKAELRHLVE